MGCLSSKTADKAPKSSIQYVPPGPASQAHQPPIERSSMVDSGGNLGTSPHNGMMGYNQNQPARGPSPPLEDDGTLYVARYAYQARTAEDLSFEKGEQLRVSKKTFMSCECMLGLFGIVASHTVKC